MKKNSPHKSLLSELEAFLPEQNKHQILEARARHVISSAINLLELMETSFDIDECEGLTKKLLLSIKQKDPRKFINRVRVLKEEYKKDGNDG